jgi:hypothetical protein
MTTRLAHRPETHAPRTDERPPMAESAWFPGRWVGGISLVLGPLLLLTGVLLRIQFHFFFPQQLEAAQAHPTLMLAAYSAFLAGNIVVWPGIVTLARLIGAARPGWAKWGGTLAIFGLFARTFHAGVDHLAFQLVRIQGVETATQVVGDSYGAFHIVKMLNAAIMFGWFFLAIGAYRSGTLGLLRSVALGLMGALMMGVLKGSSAVSVVATAGLCVALVPLGFQVLRDGPRPAPRAVLGYALLVIAGLTVMFLLSQAG